MLNHEKKTQCFSLAKEILQCQNVFQVSRASFLVLCVWSVKKKNNEGCFWMFSHWLKSKGMVAVHLTVESMIFKKCLWLACFTITEESSCLNLWGLVDTVYICWDVYLKKIKCQCFFLSLSLPGCSFCSPPRTHTHTHFFSYTHV